ncbi:molybdopterin molybdotransferase MoeA [Longirhabdus pacifica]|uniref:molybdopterin molybdotransferase MoeA n=1 Tax=Longirhabdus pacifica TaxID=2305227 RepID=UPI0010092ABB|nr:gephyrin-like molybdotransferase Glp [Longirhabdus pacifica]
MRHRHTVEVTTARKMILEDVQSGLKERMSLKDAIGRYVAQPIVATHDVPSFHRSPYDGYAIVAEDTDAANDKNPVYLPEVDIIYAGDTMKRTLKRGHSMRVMTGAAIPDGANAVIPLELVTCSLQDGKPTMQVKRKIKMGTNISYAGEDIQSGSLLIEKGKKIDAGMMAICATFGYDQVTVYRKPKVGILCSGSELLPIEAPLQHGMIRNSNAYMLMGQIQRVGAEPVLFPVVQDDREETYHRIANAIEEVDILITTGGASIGDRDYIPAILNDLEYTCLFDKVAMRPGSVTTAAKKGCKYIFALSGNPSACYVGFELFVQPLIMACYGIKQQAELALQSAILSHDIVQKHPFTRFIRAKTYIADATCMIQTIGLDKSGSLSSLLEANALLVVERGSPTLLAGDKLNYIALT